MKIIFTYILPRIMLGKKKEENIHKGSGCALKAFFDVNRFITNEDVP